MLRYLWLWLRTADCELPGAKKKSLPHPRVIGQKRRVIGQKRRLWGDGGERCFQGVDQLTRLAKTELLWVGNTEAAGVARWPKPFMALRASWRTELDRSGSFVNQLLNACFGHTGMTAEMQATDDCSPAAGGGNSWARQGPSGHL